MLSRWKRMRPPEGLKEKLEEESEIMFKGMKKAVAEGFESYVVSGRLEGKQMKSRRKPKGFEEPIADEYVDKITHKKGQDLVGEKGDVFVDVYGDDGMDWDIVEKFRWRRDKRAWYEVRTKGGQRQEKKVGEVMQITGEIGNKADDYDIVNAVKHVDEDDKLEEPEALMKKKEKDLEENDDDDPERFGSEAMEVTEDWSVVMVRKRAALEIPDVQEAVGYVEKCIIPWARRQR